MTSSPTPSERERTDKELKEKEAAEQAALPYKWTQTIGDVDISVPVAGHLRGRDIEVILTKKRIKVAIKGETEAILDVYFLPFLSEDICIYIYICMLMLMLMG